MTEIVSADNGQIWRDWGVMDYCPDGPFATAFCQNASILCKFDLNE